MNKTTENKTENIGKIDYIINLLTSKAKPITIITILTASLLLLNKPESQTVANNLFKDESKHIFFNTSDILPVTKEEIQTRIAEINTLKMDYLNIVMLIDNEKSPKTHKKDKIATKHNNLVNDWISLNKYEQITENKINNLNISKEESGSNEAIINYTKFLLNSYLVREEVKNNEIEQNKSITLKMLQKPKGIIKYQDDELCSHTTYKILEATKDYDRFINRILSQYKDDTEGEYKRNSQDELLNQIYTLEVVIHNIQPLASLDKELENLKERLAFLNQLSKSR